MHLRYGPLTVDSIGAFARDVAARKTQAMLRSEEENQQAGPASGVVDRVTARGFSSFLERQHLDRVLAVYNSASRCCRLHPYSSCAV